MTGVDAYLSGLEDRLKGGNDDGNQLIKEAIGYLFSQEPEKIIQTTRFEKNDLYWVTAVEMLYHFIVKDFCDYDNQMNIQSAINRLYQSRVSLQGKGRDELFKAIASDQRILQLLEGVDVEKRKA